jgi:hypothetical protein
MIYLGRVKTSVMGLAADNKSTLTEHDRSLIRGELERLLALPEFRGSKRCSGFLTYVVEQTLLGGRESELKERAIGIEVFDRTPDYDPSEDSIVRVAAREVRKKLLQAYVGIGSGQPVRIDLPPGSYCAEFQWSTIPPEALPSVPKAPAAPAWGLKWWWLIVLSAAALLGSFFLGWQSKSRTTAVPAILQEFWVPVTQSSSPVLMCIGTPMVYDVSNRLKNSYIQTLSQEARMRPFVVPMGPEQKVLGADIIPRENAYAGFGNLHTAADLVALMGQMNKPWQVRTASDVSFAELRTSPAILIGGESNVWTQPLTTELRFYFSREADMVIRDRTRPKERWSASGIGDTKLTEDFAIVSRIIDAKTGNCLIFLGGLTQFGTQAAGELVTHQDQLNNALRNAPRDWSRKNLQLVIRTQIHGLTPSAPTVVAAHFW